MQQKGFAPIVILIAVLITTSIGGYVYLQQNSSKDIAPLPDKKEQSLSVSVSPTPAISPIPTVKPKISSIPTKAPISKPTSKPTPTVIPTPVVRSLTVSGFAYEDRNDDGHFNSDDVKLPNMHLRYYDSVNQNLAWDIYTENNGIFSVSLNVKGNLVVDAQTYNNFRPRDNALSFSNSSTNIAIPFRSASAPVINQSGVLEGDIFNDSNHNSTRDDGESGTYFYKLYLQDENGNYYNTVENAQATDAGGHFKYENLPIGKRFTITLSNPTGAYTINQTTYNHTLTNTTPTISNITIPVIKN